MLVKIKVGKLDVDEKSTNIAKNMQL